MILTVQLDTDKPQDRATLNLLLQANVATQQQSGATVAPDPPEKTDVEPEETSPEVDADGVEWDGAIHASTKTKTQDGRWTKRRQRKATPKAVPAEKKVAESDEAPTAEYGMLDLQTVIKKHVGKWGIDRTISLLKEKMGIDHPRDITTERVSEAVELFKNDDGGKTDNIDISEFC
jgi:hypothetical protein